MEYIKIPYIILNGKKYGGDLSFSNQDALYNVTAGFIDESRSEIYGGTFQELAKKYQSGEDPADTSMGGIINNPEKILTLHKAISVVANKFGYDAPKEEYLVGGASSELYQILTQFPNSYFVTNFTDGRENVLATIDENFYVTSILLPVDIGFTFPVTADKNSNILIPEEAYDQDLEVM
jgi:hypothetical protein